MKNNQALPRFPLRYIDDEGDEYLLEDEMAVQTRTEFLEDTDSYSCYDADGNRVRLITYGLELLICQIVPDTFDHLNLKIAGNGRRDNESIFVEHYRGAPLRSLRGQGNANPHHWATPFSLGIALSELTENVMTNLDFHKRWMGARIGRRYP